MRFNSGANGDTKRCRPDPTPFGAVGTQAKARQMGQAQNVGALGSADRGSKTVGVRRGHMQSARIANSQAWGAGGAGEGGKEQTSGQPEREEEKGLINAALGALVDAAHSELVREWIDAALSAPVGEHAGDALGAPIDAANGEMVQ